MQYKLKMNHKGAKAEAAGAGQGADRSFSITPVVPYEVKGDFLAWVEVDGTIPFAALITKESMKDPGEFSK